MTTFFAIEMKGCEPVEVSVGLDEVVVLSKVELVKDDKKKKEEESVRFLRILDNGKKHVISHLHTQHLPGQAQSLCFFKNFKLAHTWVDGTVWCSAFRFQTRFPKRRFLKKIKLEDTAPSESAAVSCLSCEREFVSMKGYLKHFCRPDLGATLNSMPGFKSKHLNSLDEDLKI